MFCPMRRVTALLRGLLASLMAVAIVGGADRAAAADPVNLAIGYLHPAERQLTLSLVDRPTKDLGSAGARLAIEDNNTTGRFTGQHYTLDDEAVSTLSDVTAALDTFEKAGVSWVIADLKSDLLLPLADAAAKKNILVFNVGAPDDALRLDNCRSNLINVVPSRAMLADALAQYLIWKRWPRWFLIEGSHPDDHAFAQAIRRAAARFGGKIVDDRVFKDTGGARTTDSGSVLIQRQIPVFMQGAPAHDVVIVADESEVFGAYVPYRTWDPRPVAGTAGLVPTVWSPVHEQWGAIQLQDRFVRHFHRGMRQQDMLAWMAVRMIGEAATRTGSADRTAIETYMKGPKFELAAYKGQPLTLRSWNLQLRQPILLADGKTVVSVSPQEGFLHPKSFLDTLGYDEPESHCRLASTAAGSQ